MQSVNMTTQNIILMCCTLTDVRMCQNNREMTLLITEILDIGWNLSCSQVFSHTVSEYDHSEHHIYALHLGRCQNVSE